MARIAAAFEAPELAPLPANNPPRESWARYLGPASVARVADAGDRVWVTFEGERSLAGAWARVALAGPHALIAGDRVLVIGDPGAGFYVIGVLDAADRRTEARSARALGQALRCEYDEPTDTARVIVEAGNLQFASPAGSISFVCRQGVRVESETLNLEARSGVSLRGGEVRVSGERGTIALKETAYTGASLVANVGRLLWIAERVESRAGIVVERAKQVYRSVEELCQTKAGRVRMLVATSFRLKSKRMVVKAEDACKVDAERIELG